VVSRRRGTSKRVARSPKWAPANVGLAQILVAGGLGNQALNL